MSLEKDILDAESILANIHRDNEELVNRFFELYPFTTENIEGYYNLINLKNKSVLTVGSSADQILNAMLLDAKKVTCVDINPFVKYYYELKKAAIKALPREEFLKFFCYRDYYDRSYRNHEAFHIKTYYKISSHLEKDAKMFWEQLFLDFSGEEIRERLFSKEETPKEKLEKINFYCNEENYNELKEKLNNTEVAFVKSDIREFSKQSNEKFDHIFLSNITSYLENMYEKDQIENFKTVIDGLKNNLTKDGKIMMAYLYITDENSTYRNSYPKIYDIDHVYKVFGKENLEFKTFKGINGILWEDTEKDAAIFYKNEEPER